MSLLNHVRVPAMDIKLVNNIDSSARVVRIAGAIPSTSRFCPQSEEHHAFYSR